MNVRLPVFLHFDKRALNDYQYLHHIHISSIRLSGFFFSLVLSLFDVPDCAKHIHAINHIIRRPSDFDLFISVEMLNRQSKCYKNYQREYESAYLENIIIKWKLPAAEARFFLVQNEKRDEKKKIIIIFKTMEKHAVINEFGHILYL